jgi:hypothetical protein
MSVSKTTIKDTKPYSLDCRASNEEIIHFAETVLQALKSR